jgi:GNAT superfamily N-acetyltransferase
MEIRELDVNDDELFHRCYAIMREAELFERPEAPMWSEPEMAVMIRVPEESERWEVYGAYDGDHLAGVGFIVFPLLDNTSMTWTGVDVPPESRRRGIGGELLEFLVRRSAEAGRSVVLVESVYGLDRRDDHPYRRFAESHGFTLGSIELQSRLDLPVDDAVLQSWIDEAAPHHPAYDITTYVGDLPEHIVPSFCRVTNQLPVDAPTGDIDFEAEKMTPTTWRQREAKVKLMGRTLYHTIATDSSGDAVAVTTIGVPEHDPPKVYQWATLVQREHRGHRLGLAVKARNLRCMQHDNPDRAVIYTGNEETNQHMLAINQKMGFRPVELMVEFQRKL